MLTRGRDRPRQNALNWAVSHLRKYVHFKHALAVVGPLRAFFPARHHGGVPLQCNHLERVLRGVLLLAFIALFLLYGVDTLGQLPPYVRSLLTGLCKAHIGVFAKADHVALAIGAGIAQTPPTAAIRPNPEF